MLRKNCFSLLKQFFIVQKIGGIIIKVKARLIFFDFSIIGCICYKKRILQQRIKNLRHHIVNKSLAGAFVLCAFLLSITPKQILHRLAANHKDRACQKINDSHKFHYNTFGFNCDCDSIVATSPFTETPVEFAIPKLIHFSFYQESSSSSLSSSDHFYFKLRGPPVTV